MAEIRKELSDFLSSDPANQDELDKVKANNTLSLPGRWETSGAVLRDINEIVTYKLDDDYWDSYADRVRKLSLDEVNAAAHAIIKPGSLVWVVVGDREKIADRIRGLEIGNITELDVNGNPL